LDHLLYTLFEQVLPYYAQKQRRQLFGFEGPDLEMHERAQVSKRASLIPPDHIEVVNLEAGTFRVRSQSNADLKYSVDLESYTCECPHFP
ncbi:hypothetical protein FA95DRAFT_1451703, partial [Auriscalpium vulgare]